MPRYDGRSSAITADDVLLSIPRALLYPLYFTSEYLVRRPVGTLLAWGERSGAPKFLYDFFIFGENHDAGVIPLAYVHFGFNPSVGLLGFWNNAGVRGHNVSIQGSTWGIDWLALIVRQSLTLSPNLKVSQTVSGTRRPDLRFYGVGPNSNQRDLRRYGQALYEQQLQLEFVPRLSNASTLELSLGQRHSNTYNGRYDDDIGIESDPEKRALPVGYQRGFASIDTGLAVALDSRSTRDPQASGVRLEVAGKLSSNMRDLDANKSVSASSWLNASFALGGFWELHHGRVIGFGVHGRFVEGLSNAEAVPFTELADPGGEGPLPGFLPGRIRGQSTAAATLRYQWPVWLNLNGKMQFGVGNAFGPRLREFSAPNLRWSAAIGLETASSRTSAFHILIGVGSDTFGNGAGIDSVRLVFGTHRGL
jgi:hypothetical protein